MIIKAAALAIPATTTIISVASIFFYKLVIGQDIKGMQTNSETAKTICEQLARVRPNQNQASRRQMVRSLDRLAAMRVRTLPPAQSADLTPSEILDGLAAEWFEGFDTRRRLTEAFPDASEHQKKLYRVAISAWRECAQIDLFASVSGFPTDVIPGTETLTSDP